MIFYQVNYMFLFIPSFIIKISQANVYFCTSTDQQHFSKYINSCQSGIKWKLITKFIRTTIVASRAYRFINTYYILLISIWLQPSIIKNNIWSEVCITIPVIRPCSAILLPIICEVSNMKMTNAIKLYVYFLFLFLKII